MRISNTKLDLYIQCPRKFKFRYIEKVKGDYTATPLLYGIAMDNALNFLLECKQEGVPHSVEQAKVIFLKYMNLWHGQNRLEFFKNEMPELPDRDGMSIEEVEQAVWNNILQRGYNSIEVYEKEVLPQIAEVLEVQKRGTLDNGEGDTFEFIVDAIVKLHDGRVVLLDNKTASAKYPKNKVIKSQQLSLYLENYPDIKYAGYAVLIKNPDKEKGMTHQFMVDEIPEETKQNSFDLLEDTLYKIKKEQFPCNYKSCKAFGKPCEYSRACQYGDYSGLVPTYAKVVKEGVHPTQEELDPTEDKE